MRFNVTSSGYFSMVCPNWFQLTANPTNQFIFTLFDLTILVITSHKYGFTEYHLQYKDFELIGLFYGHQEYFGLFHVKLMNFMEKLN